MKYNQPFGISDPNAVYINGNPSTGTMGSIPPAESIEHPQREIVEVITDSGITPASADLKQLAKGIQSGKMNYGVDVGTVNNLQITVAPIPLLKSGLAVRILAVQSNTGAAVLNVNALGPKKIRRPGDTDLLANDITLGSISSYVYNEGLQAGVGAWEMQGLASGAPDSGPSGVMTANQHLYVNFAIGSDTNNGTANTAGAALKTIQKAIDIAWGYQPSQYLMTIHVADSTSYVQWKTPIWQGPQLLIQGNTATPANVACTANSAFVNTAHIQGLNTVTIDGFKLITTTGDPNHQNYGLGVYNGANVIAKNLEFGYCDGGMFVAVDANIAITASIRIAGGTLGQVICAGGQGTITSSSCNYNITVAVNGTVWASAGYGFIQMGTVSGVTFTNFPNFTGKKYDAQQNGIILTNGAGSSFFPGGTAGTTATGGQYS